MNRIHRAPAWTTIAITAATLVACSGDRQSDVSGTSSFGSASSSVSPSNQAPSPYLAIARGRVDVEGGMVNVTAQRDGVIAAVDAQQGDDVKAGQILAQMDPRAARIELAGTQAQVEQARAQLAELDVKLREAQHRAPRIAAAAKAGAATGDAADAARNEAAGLKAQRDAARAALDAAQQRVAAAQYEVDERSLRAPAAGRVVQRDAQIGQTVSAQSGAVLFEILPDRPRIVRAELDAEDADRIKAGMNAQVVRDTGEGAAYDAKVLRVGEVLGSATLSNDPLARAAAREVDCVLQLQPSRSANGAPLPPLRIGERVLVRFAR